MTSSRNNNSHITGLSQMTGSKNNIGHITGLSQMTGSKYNNGHIAGLNKQGHMTSPKTQSRPYNRPMKITAI